MAYDLPPSTPHHHPNWNLEMPPMCPPHPSSHRLPCDTPASPHPSLTLTLNAPRPALWLKRVGPVTVCGKKQEQKKIPSLCPPCATPCLLKGNPLANFPLTDNSEMKVLISSSTRANFFQRTDARLKQLHAGSAGLKIKFGMWFATEMFGSLTPPSGFF